MLQKSQDIEFGAQAVSEKFFVIRNCIGILQKSQDIEFGARAVSEKFFVIRNCIGIPSAL